MALVPGEGSELEAKAVEMARHAGWMLRGRFGQTLQVNYKDKEKQDPVTSADTECQAYLCEAIAAWFPDHGIVAEETEREAEQEVEATSPDYLWVLDPLDGTTNFLNGLPVYGVSIGVLYRGVPVASALFIPWAGEKGGFVLHARKGGGAWMDDDPVSIPQSEGPEPGRLTGLPGSFGAAFSLRKGLRRRVGQPRVTGSIVYELALTVKGAFQYAVIATPKIWDVAGGVLIVEEAGGAVLTRRRKARGWEALTYLGPSWEGGAPTLKEMRQWTAPLIVGSAQVAAFVADNLRRRSHPLAPIARLMKVLRLRKR